MVCLPFKLVARGKWRMLFLIGHFQVKSSIAVTFWFFEVCAVQFCVLGELFNAGSPAGIIVSVESLERASMMLENPKLIRTPSSSLTRWSCALFQCVITIYIYIHEVHAISFQTFLVWELLLIVHTGNSSPF